MTTAPSHHHPPQLTTVKMSETDDTDLSTARDTPSFIEAVLASPSEKLHAYFQNTSTSCPLIDLIKSQLAHHVALGRGGSEITLTKKHYSELVQGKVRALVDLSIDHRLTE